MPVSPDTLLRIMRSTPLDHWPEPRVLGVDDFALRNGQVYGTILVDLEHQRPIDLLPDRSAETLRAWLQQHPDIAVIARDRSTEYARGARSGAPAAQQVADRWHLLHNLRETVERMLGRRHAALRYLPGASPTVTEAAAPLAERRKPAVLQTPSASERLTSSAARDRRRAQYTAVRRLSAEGRTILQIAKHLSISRSTVRRFQQAAEFPERGRWRRAPSMLDPYLSHLQARWTSGCHNASQLWREVRALGYPGTRKQVERWAQHH